MLRLKHGERLSLNGRVDQSNIDVHYRPTDKSNPFQPDIFTLGGRGEEAFMPRFNYKGFQDVEVTNSRPVALAAGSPTGYFTHGDVAPVGQVKSANPTIGKIWWATNNSYLSNLFGYPADGPSAKKTVEPATPTSPAKPAFTTSTALPFTKSGWPTTATSSRPTACCPPSSPPTAGATSGATARTEPAPSPSFPGTSTCFMAIQNCSPIATATPSATSTTLTPLAPTA